jgi:hypothetical protein
MHSHSVPGIWSLENRFLAKKPIQLLEPFFTSRTILSSDSRSHLFSARMKTSFVALPWCDAYEQVPTAKVVMRSHSQLAFASVFRNSASDENHNSQETGATFMAFHSMARWKLSATASVLVFTLTVLLLMALPVSAADLSGKVINGTTRKLQAGDDVVLLVPSGDGMNEVARTKTDDAGRFRFSIVDAKAMHLVRVVHEGVTCHQVAELGTDSVAVEVDRLEVKQLVTMRNE